MTKVKFYLTLWRLKLVKAFWNFGCKMAAADRDFEKFEHCYKAKQKVDREIGKLLLGDVKDEINKFVYRKQ